MWNKVGGETIALLNLTMLIKGKGTLLLNCYVCATDNMKTFPLMIANSHPSQVQNICKPTHKIGLNGIMLKENVHFFPSVSTKFQT